MRAGHKDCLCARARCCMTQDKTEQRYAAVHEDILREDTRMPQQAAARCTRTGAVNEWTDRGRRTLDAHILRPHTSRTSVQELHDSPFHAAHHALPLAAQGQERPRNGVQVETRSTGAHAHKERECYLGHDTCTQQEHCTHMHRITRARCQARGPWHSMFLLSPCCLLARTPLETCP